MIEDPGKSVMVKSWKQLLNANPIYSACTLNDWFIPATDRYRKKSFNLCGVWVLFLSVVKTVSFIRPNLCCAWSD